MFGLGPVEMLIVGAIAVLLFGSRLPEVGRSLGKGIVEFKKGLADIKNEVDSATYAQPSSRVAQRYNADDHDEPTAPKFEPPTQAPTEITQTAAASSEVATPETATPEVAMPHAAMPDAAPAGSSHAADHAV